MNLPVDFQIWLTIGFFTAFLWIPLAIISVSYQISEMWHPLVLE